MRRAIDGPRRVCCRHISHDSVTACVRGWGGVVLSLVHVCDAVLACVVCSVPGEYVALSTTAMTTYSSSTLPPPAWTSSHITSAAVDVTLDDQQLQLQHQPLPRGTLTDDDTAAVDMHTARPDTLSDHRHTDTATGSS